MYRPHFWGILHQEIHSLYHRHLPRVLANSIPKAGTHLLTRLLVLLGFLQKYGTIDIGPGEGLEHIHDNHIFLLKNKLSGLKQGLFAKTHLYFFHEIADLLREFQIKTITILRDPRDVCVSDAFYIAKTQNHRLHPFYLKMSKDEQLMASIEGLSSEILHGAPPSLDIGSHYKNYKGWITEGVGLIIRFEELIGEKGGGLPERQRAIISEISAYLEIELSNKRFETLCTAVFWPRAQTFRRGQIGSWKKHFKPQHLEAFNRVFGNMIQDFGYVDD